MIKNNVKNNLEKQVDRIKTDSRKKYKKNYTHLY